MLAENLTVYTGQHITRTTLIVNNNETVHVLDGGILDIEQLFLFELGNVLLDPGATLNIKYGKTSRCKGNFYAKGTHEKKVTINCLEDQNFTIIPTLHFIQYNYQLNIKLTLQYCNIHNVQILVHSMAMDAIMFCNFTAERDKWNYIDENNNHIY